MTALKAIFIFIDTPQEIFLIKKIEGQRLTQLYSVNSDRGFFELISEEFNSIK
jgi:hypothetical protein